MMMKEVEKSRKRKIQELFSFQVFSLPWKVEKEHWKSLGIIKKCFVFWFFPLQTFFSTSFSGVSAFDGSYQHQQSSYIYIISTSSQPFHRMTFSSLDMFGKNYTNFLSQISCVCNYDEICRIFLMSSHMRDENLAFNWAEIWYKCKKKNLENK